MKTFISFALLSTKACHRLSKLPPTSNYYFGHVKKEKYCAAVTNEATKKKIVFKTNLKFLPEECRNTESLVHAVVQSINFDEKLFRDMIRKQPEISTFNSTSVISNLTQLMQLGFDYGCIKKITAEYPHILTYEKLDIYDTFETWRKCFLFEKFLWSLFTDNPLLFSVSNDEVQMRVKRIFYLMGNKINRVTNLLSKNPQIMFCPWSEVEEKFNYLYTTWRVLEKDISRSSALSLPIAHIKLRYTCLERCGVYIRPKKKDDVGFDPRKNPSLTSVVDTNDESFALNVAKISPEEFEVFKKLMNYEDRIENEDPTEYDENETITESEFDNNDQ